MESDPVQMIELLSLQQSANGYQMAVRISRESACTDCVVELDEYTYNQVLSILPQSRGRSRLSLYTKWDPYRRLHYSHISYKEGDLRSTLYFACSTAYIAKLQLLKEGIVPVDEAERLSPVHEASQLKPMRITKLGTSQPKRQVFFRLAAFSLFIMIAVISTSDRLFNEEDDSLTLSVNAASSLYEQPAQTDNRDRLHVNTAVYSVSQNEKPRPVSFSTAQEELKEEELKEEELKEEQLKEEQLKDEDKLYESYVLEGDKAIYALPKGYVALTFDDGPSAYTEEIVDILKEQKVAATFLFIGKNTRKYPDAVAYASDQKMSVGNHSWDHADLEHLKRDEKLENVGMAAKAIEKLTKQTNTVFRPPYGSISDTLIEDLHKNKMKVLMWNRDPEDWKADSSDAIMSYFHKVDPSGGIYVLHEKEKTVKALPAIIKYLKNKKLKFVIFE
ncbi:peptidoglycan/xylan/chitin deacetylase (PgdA/CDA1 family) [Paenibacillus endophyticus]|uniref:Peptidoglycan/xylan/chitin deacetylase (PgdA/CDA1 family) n=1 Tax=Paenibacillus endophyticus TaxID=1294268 RepID=A0A7W5G8K6_9BACL|nr:polysaccharide deacetylase family protein [Paenibacillus endophyticus]MBB3150716.1 peptidoglycan/xylan/chitin deacetylase (PgdA/CDA1 family) [Paenibacillus endophyticus]